MTSYLRRQCYRCDAVRTHMCFPQSKKSDHLQILCRVQWWPLIKETSLSLFCTMNNKCTIISQIITLLHVSTLSCLPQGACNKKFAKLHRSRGSVLAFGTQVRGFKPGRRRQIFKGQIKIFSTPSFGGEVKPSVPCRRFAACKRSLNVTWKSTFRQKLPAMILAHAVPPFATRGSLGLHGRGGRTSNESGDVKNTWIIRG